MLVFDEVKFFTFKFYVSDPRDEFSHDFGAEVVYDAKILDWLLLIDELQLSFEKRVLFMERNLDGHLICIILFKTKSEVLE